MTREVLFILPHYSFCWKQTVSPEDHYLRSRHISLLTNRYPQLHVYRQHFQSVYGCNLRVLGWGNLRSKARIIHHFDGKVYHSLPSFPRSDPVCHCWECRLAVKFWVINTASKKVPTTLFRYLFLDIMTNSGCPICTTVQSIYHCLTSPLCTQLK